MLDHGVALPKDISDRSLKEAKARIDGTWEETKQPAAAAPVAPAATGQLEVEVFSPVVGGAAAVAPLGPTEIVEGSNPFF